MQDLASKVKNNKNLWVSGLIVVVLVIVLSALPKPAGQDNKDQEILENLTEETSQTEDKPLSRSEALIAYAGKKIDIVNGCEVDPESQEQKKGTVIMLNNNTDVAHTVVVGSKTYSVGAQRYRLSLLETAGEVVVSCDDNEEVASIIVSE